MADANYLDLAGLRTLWKHIGDVFVKKDGSKVLSELSFTSGDKNKILQQETLSTLEAEDIRGTTKVITFDEDDNLQSIVHTNIRGNVVRTDTFTFDSEVITEVRTLPTGESLTIVTNTDTLITTTTYATA